MPPGLKINFRLLGAFEWFLNREYSGRIGILKTHETLTVMSKTKRGPRLHDMRSLRRELGHLYREARAGKVDIQDASRLANILGILARIIQSSDIETRLEALERAANP